MRAAVIILLVSLMLGAGEKKYVVGFVQDSMKNRWRIAQVEQFKAALEHYPDITLKVVESGGSTARQIANIEEMAEMGVDVLVTSPRDAEAMTPVLSSIYRRGTPVVLLSRGINSRDFSAFCHADDFAIGRMSGRFIAGKLGGKGTVLMLKGVPGATTALERTRGFMRVIGDYPKIRVIERTGNYLSGDAIKETEELLNQGVKFDAVYAQSDSMAMGAVMSIKAHGIDPKKLVITGIDFTAAALELLRSGDLDATFSYPTAGGEGALAVRKILDGKTIEKEVIIDSVMVTPKNAERYRPIF